MRPGSLFGTCSPRVQHFLCDMSEFRSECLVRRTMFLSLFARTCECTLRSFLRGSCTFLNNVRNTSYALGPAVSRTVIHTHTAHVRSAVRGHRSPARRRSAELNRTHRPPQWDDRVRSRACRRNGPAGGGCATLEEQSCRRGLLPCRLGTVEASLPRRRPQRKSGVEWCSLIVSCTM